MAELREQLTSTAHALQQIVETLAHSDGDHEIRMRSALAGLGSVAESLEAAPLRSQLAAADDIQQNLEQARKGHAVTIAQFQVEIRTLHERIDAFESAASLDALTKLFTRRGNRAANSLISPRGVLPAAGSRSPEFAWPNWNSARKWVRAWPVLSAAGLKALCPKGL